MQNNKYFIEKNIAKFNKDGFTYFLDGLELNTIKNRFNKEKIKYNIYSSFDDCDYKILYKNEIPKVCCFQIICDNELRHSDIMGALYNLNLDNHLFGDIIINGYYFIILSEMSEYIKNNLKLIGRYSVKLVEKESPIYSREYEDIELIVSSLRIDTVISRLINSCRSDIDDYISRKDIILNYDVLTNKSYVLKEGDTFSIRKYGKYKYASILRTTKKDSYVIKIKRYK